MAEQLYLLWYVNTKAKRYGEFPGIRPMTLREAENLKKAQSKHKWRYEIAMPVGQSPDISIFEPQAYRSYVYDGGMVKISLAQWKAIHPDFKGRVNGYRAAFAGSIEGYQLKSWETGTTMLQEGVHFEITKD